MNFRSWIVVLCFFLSINLFGQRIKQAKAHFQTTTDTLRGDFNTIEVFLVNVQLKKNGKTYTFLVDTGAPTAISSAIAKELAFDTTSFAKVNALDSKRESIAFVHVDSLLAGSTIFTNQTAFVWSVENTQILSCAGIDGILGSNTLNACQILFDWQHAQMILAQKTADFNLPKSSYQTKIHFQGNQKAPYIYSTKPKTRFLVDTGFNGYISFMSNQKQQVEDLPYAKSKYTSVGSPAEGAFGYMKPDSSFTYSLYNFQFANISVDSIEIEITPGRIPKIGNLLLKNYLVHFNPKNKRLSFYPNSSQKHYPETAFGVSILPNDTSYFVSSIDIDGLAHKEGIELNDVVLSVNNISLSPKKEIPCTVLFEIRHLIKQRNSVTLIVQKPDGEISTVQLDKNLR